MTTPSTQPRIVKTSTPRTEMVGGVAQIVTIATWSNGETSTEIVSNLSYSTPSCIKH